MGGGEWASLGRCRGSSCCAWSGRGFELPGNRPARQVARAKERWAGLQRPHRLAHWEPKVWACACFLNNQPSSSEEPGLQNELGEPASLISLALGSTVALVDSEELESVGVSVGWT